MEKGLVKGRSLHGRRQRAKNEKGRREAKQKQRKNFQQDTLPIEPKEKTKRLNNPEKKGAGLKVVWGRQNSGPIH